MKVFSKILIAAWLFATITSLHAFKVEKGFTSIFNGKDLTGWEGMPGMWMVKDGAITPKQSTINNWVFWRGGQPADFELRLSFRYHSGNSGRLPSPPENPVIDRGLLGSDRTVFHSPHTGHAFPAGQVFSIENRGEAFFDLEGVKGCDCGKQPCCDHNF